MYRSGAPGKHLVAEAAVTDSNCLARLAGQIDATFGRLDILVNCAGVTRFVPHPDLDSLDDALVDRIFAVNVRGVIASTRAMRHLLDRSSGGLVVNISSIAGVTAMGSNIAYFASKAAVDNLTKSLARALAPKIRVVSVSPGLVDTEFVKGLDASWRDMQASRTPLGRLGTPDDVADAVLAVATHIVFATGIVMPVDGHRGKIERAEPPLAQGTTPGRNGGAELQMVYSQASVRSGPALFAATPLGEGSHPTAQQFARSSSHWARQPELFDRRLL